MIGLSHLIEYIPLIQVSPCNFQMYQLSQTYYYSLIKGKANLQRDAIAKSSAEVFDFYFANAWGYDEVTPLSKKALTTENLGITMLCSMDTLWIMNLKTR